MAWYCWNGDGFVVLLSVSCDCIVGMARLDCPSSVLNCCCSFHWTHNGCVLFRQCSSSSISNAIVLVNVFLFDDWNRFMWMVSVVSPLYGSGGGPLLPPLLHHILCFVVVVVWFIFIFKNIF
eukprot:76977_1